MNVSSVKNLNGEVLSAVQDASLTNVIQTNSGNWQDITAYQNASATYLTEVSIPESATWNEVSTTVQTNSAKIDDTVISYQTNSGTFLTAQEVSHDNTLSGNGTVESPLGVVPGYNETVLWSGARYWWGDTSDLACSENLTNFERVSVYAKDDWELPETIFTFAPTANAFCTTIIGPEGNYEVIKSAKFLINGNIISLDTIRYVNMEMNGGVTVGSGTCFIQFNKIVGINRISASN